MKRALLTVLPVLLLAVWAHAQIGGGIVGPAGGGGVAEDDVVLIDGTNAMTGTLDSDVASGSNAISLETGGRADLGAGASDYLYSDGTAVLTGGTFTTGSTATVGTTGAGRLDAGDLRIDTNGTAGGGSLYYWGAAAEALGFKFRFDPLGNATALFQANASGAWTLSAASAQNIVLSTSGGGVTSMSAALTSNLKLGASGTSITESVRGTSVTDVASIAALAIADVDITVTGAALGDDALCGLSSALETDLTLSCYVNATDTCRLRIRNNNAVSAVDPASRTYSCRTFAP